MSISVLSVTQYLPQNKRKEIITAFFSILVFLVQVSHLQGGGIGITSATKFRSVDLIFWLEDNPSKTEETAPMAFQKTRTIVGIGEEIFLTLVGDEKTIGDVSKIKWTIPEGGENATFLVENSITKEEETSSMVEGVKTVKLVILLSTSESNDESVKVMVTTSTSATAEIRFTIKTPDGGFKSRHHSPPKYLWRIPSGQVGASAKLRVFPTPTNVNFSGGIGLFEIDEGSPLDVKPSEEDEKKGVERSTFKNFKHKPPKIYLIIGEVEGGVIDNIAFRRWVIAMKEAAFDYRKMTAPHSCYWRCGWYWREIVTNKGIYDGKEDSRGEKMQSVNQTFFIAHDGQGTGVLSKFNSKVTRIAKNNKNNTQTYE